MRTVPSRKRRTSALMTTTARTNSINRRNFFIKDSTGERFPGRPLLARGSGWRSPSCGRFSANVKRLDFQGLSLQGARDGDAGARGGLLYTSHRFGIPGAVQAVDLAVRSLHGEGASGLPGSAAGFLAGLVGIRFAVGVDQFAAPAFGKAK